jgi:hypothetical protein
MMGFIWKLVRPCLDMSFYFVCIIAKKIEKFYINSRIFRKKLPNFEKVTRYMVQVGSQKYLRMFIFSFHILLIAKIG